MPGKPVLPELPNLKNTCAYIGAGAQNRTADLLITNQLLYQLSYTSPTLAIDPGHEGRIIRRSADAEPPVNYCRKSVSRHTVRAAKPAVGRA